MAFQVPHSEHGSTRCFGIGKGAYVPDKQAYLLFGRLELPYLNAPNVLEAGWAADSGSGILIPKTPSSGVGNDEYLDRHGEFWSSCEGFGYVTRESS